MSGWVKLPIHGGATYVDFADWDLATSRRWHVNDSGYAVWRGVDSGAKKTIRLHRLVADTPDGLVTDHLNHDRLDNRRHNLRVVTQDVNAKNRPRARGYSWDASKGKWMVRHQRKFYGRYDTEEQAAHAYQLALSGVEYVPTAHPRRKYLPAGVCFMKPQSRRGAPPFYIKPRLDGKAHFQGYFRTAQEAEAALTKFWAERSK